MTVVITTPIQPIIASNPTGPKTAIYENSAGRTRFSFIVTVSDLLIVIIPVSTIDTEFFGIRCAQSPVSVYDFSLSLPMITNFKPTIIPEPTPEIIQGWYDVGNGPVSEGSVCSMSKYPSISIAPDGTPYVAWIDMDYDWEIFVKRWNGSSWEEIGDGCIHEGGISDNNIHDRGPSFNYHGYIWKSLCGMDI